MSTKASNINVIKLAAPQEKQRYKVYAGAKKMGASNQTAQAFDMMLAAMKGSEK